MSSKERTQSAKRSKGTGSDEKEALGKLMAHRGETNGLSLPWASLPLTTDTAEAGGRAGREFRKLSPEGKISVQGTMGEIEARGGREFRKVSPEGRISTLVTLGR